jgi:4-diphosphocytidyl-2-C-methyl-D-erythritol kinase
MREVRLRAFAKVNYALDVLGLRADGYHEIGTVMQSISLADEVRLQRAAGAFDLALEPEGVEIGPQERNTTYVAWKALQRLTGKELPVKVTLRKWIPAGAGLGSGSADAAAVLVGLNELFGLGLQVGELREVGAGIGADVPFCISGGTAMGEGVGEILTPLPAPPAHLLVVAKPLRNADTDKIYRAYDEASTASTRSVEPVVPALRSGSLTELAVAIGNNLTSVTASFVPEVAALERMLLASGALGASMSGSGTAVYGIFDDAETAGSAKDTVDAPFIGVYEPISCGVEIAEPHGAGTAGEIRAPGPVAWHFEIHPIPDGENVLRYNLRGPVLGRSQVARHRVLVPGSQVRILPPQPRSGGRRVDRR